MYEKQGTQGDGKATDILVISEAINIFFKDINLLLQITALLRIVFAI